MLLDDVLIAHVESTRESMDKPLMAGGDLSNMQGVFHFSMQIHSQPFILSVPCETSFYKFPVNLASGERLRGVKTGDV